MDLPASRDALRLTTNDVQDMIRGIKGVKDILPEETPRWRLIEEAATPLGLAVRVS